MTLMNVCLYDTKMWMIAVQKKYLIPMKIAKQLLSQINNITNNPIKFKSDTIQIFRNTFEIWGEWKG